MIELIDINYFTDQKQILKDINLKIQRGEFAAIVGPNGSGKTTLLNIIAGILKPTGGKLLIFDKSDISAKDRMRISYVPQKVTSFNQSFPISVIETVLLGLCPKKRLLEGYLREDLKKAEEMLKLLEIENLRDRLIGHLSGGQQQRVFLARALISNPEILILDEPTVGIDSRSEELLFEILAQKRKKTQPF